MTKKLIFLFLSAIAMWSCKSDIEQETIKEPITISFDRDTVIFTASNDSRSVNLTCNSAEELQLKASDSSWCVGRFITQKRIETKVQRNTNINERWSKITVFNNEVSKDIHVYQMGTAPAVMITPQEVADITCDTALINIRVVANIEFEVKIPADANWVTVASQSDTLVQIKVGANVNQKAREVIIDFQQVNNGLAKRSLTLKQKPYSYVPSVPEGLPEDTKIKVSGVTTSSYQGDGPASNCIDGNMNTTYHSNWSNSSPNYFPIDLVFNFTEGQEQIDYLIYYPRSNGSNGNFKEVEVWYQREGDSQLIKYGEYDFGGSGSASQVSFKNIPSNTRSGETVNGLIKPKQVKFVIKSGTNNFASCAEMEFYKRTDIIDIFTDGSYSELKKEVTEDQIAAIENQSIRNIATALYNNVYPKEYRITKYEAILSPAQLAADLRIGQAHSRYEGVTGMYLEAGEHTVFVSDLNGKSITLLLPNWMRKPQVEGEGDWSLHCQRIALREGVNTINVNVSTNAYISYYDYNPAACKPITVHFATGQVNGYFDVSKHNNTDWNRLLNSAPSPMMDMLGKHVQVAYPIEFFKKYASSRGVELISNYDRMINNMYKLMGLEKYNKMPKNRLLSRVNFHYYMFRDGDGVAYLGNNGTMNMVVNPDNVIKGDPCWGFSHEAGHGLQMQPQMTWGGMTEVSNNIYSLYSTTMEGNQSRLDEYNTYAKGLEEIVNNPNRKSYLHNGDVFCRLIPLWQLHLYFTRNGHPDFYGDVMESLRNKPHAGTGNNSINNQFQFIETVCDVVQLDLTEFFEKWGYFWVGSIAVGDYGSYNFTITEEMVNSTKTYISKYPKPEDDITLTRD
ncbi:MAG: M60 family metallopeptidase [Marinifilaceae bacterium]